jgi:secreted trypsin-like serine protease
MNVILLSSLALAAPIVNGQAESGFPSTVALGADFNGYVFSACTGNLITPRIVLTAAHCGDEVPLEALVSYGAAFFGDDVNTAEEVIGMEELIVHPDYRELGTESAWDYGEYDVALLLLDEEASTVPTLFRSDAIDREEEGTPLVSVGFGITGADRNDGGVKRSAGLVLSNVQSMFLIVDNEDNEDSSNICSGDSGGPMFHYNEEHGIYEQWAVHSWGDQSCLATSGSTRTDVVSEWITDYIEEVHGTRDICEANGWYGDGECTTYDACLEEDPDCIVPEPEETGGKLACSATAGGAGWMAALLALYSRRRLG